MHCCDDNHRRIVVAQGNDDTNIVSSGVKLHPALERAEVRVRLRPASDAAIPQCSENARHRYLSFPHPFLHMGRKDNIE